MANETLKQNLIKSKYTQVINPLIASLPHIQTSQLICSLWCLKKSYEVLKGLHKTFWSTTKSKSIDWFLYEGNTGT